MSKSAQARAIARSSFALLSEDKELLWIPGISMVMALGVMAIFLYPLSLFNNGILGLILLFGLVVSMTFVGLLCNAAIICAVVDRLDGDDPNIAGSFSAAWERKGKIFQWAVVSATVGLIIRAIEERAGFLGALVGMLAGMSWTVVTFMVLPIIVVDDISVKDAINKSGEMLKATWGQRLRSSVRIGLVFLLPMVGLFAVGALSIFVGGPMLILTPLVAIALVGLVMVSSVLQTVYQTVVYVFAATGEVPAGFDREIMQSIFTGSGRHAE